MNFAVRRFRRSTDLPAAGFNFLRALLMSGVFYVMAGGRRDISVERVALNIEDAEIPDNAGNRPVDRPVVRGGPAAYWSTLPIKDVVAALRAADLPGSVSCSAGTFVCNHVFYGLMRTLARQRKMRGGFIHVPYLPEQARRIADGSPSLALDKIVRGLKIVIKTSLITRRDFQGDEVYQPSCSCCHASALGCIEDGGGIRQGGKRLGHHGHHNF